jgi:transposase
MGKKSGYPSDVSDEEWAFVVPYLVLLDESSGQRRYPLREVFNGMRYILKSGAPWRWMPNDFPPWEIVYQQTQRWIRAGVFVAMVEDLRVLLRICEGKEPLPSAAIFDSRTLQSTPESGARAGYDGGKKRKGSKVHLAVDTLGHLLGLYVTPANEQDRAQVSELAAQVQDATGNHIEIAFVDAGYTGQQAADDAAAEGIELCVVKLDHVKQGFVLLPKRWVVERSFAWTSRFRRLARDYERLPETLAGIHVAVFAILMVQRWVALVPFSS